MIHISHIITHIHSWSIMIYLGCFLFIFLFLQLKEPKQLVSGNDFYAFPRIDPNGKKMAWIEWSHPNIIWDKAQLWVGYFSECG